MSLQLVRKFDMVQLINAYHAHKKDQRLQPLIAPPTVTFQSLARMLPNLSEDHLWVIYTLASVHLRTFGQLEQYLMRHNVI
jgi:hypothetical protein